MNVTRHSSLTLPQIPVESDDTAKATCMAKAAPPKVCFHFTSFNSCICTTHLTFHDPEHTLEGGLSTNYTADVLLEKVSSNL